ncbi:hypothetical protein D8B45_05455 [Candidatus Gracilibacteria bacterium]|nr:MAG: hypothetical protein D8B45_05455 [Candidatus Gracilibacteria bacterium]
MKKIGFLLLFSFLLSGCFFIKPSNSIAENQDPKGSLNSGQAICDAEDSCNDEQISAKLSQNLADLKIGDTIGGLTLQSKEIAQDHAAFLLTGATKVTGTIKMYKDEETDELLVDFTPEQTLVTIHISDGKLSNYSIKLFEGNIGFASFDAQTRQALLAGEELQVELSITSFFHVGWFESEYYSTLEISGYKVILD